MYSRYTDESEKLRKQPKGLQNNGGKWREKLALSMAGILGFSISEGVGFMARVISCGLTTAVNGKQSFAKFCKRGEDKGDPVLNWLYFL